MSVPDLLDPECEKCGTFNIKLICESCSDKRQAKRDVWIVEKVGKFMMKKVSSPAQNYDIGMATIYEKLKKLLGDKN